MNPWHYTAPEISISIQIGKQLSIFDWTNKKMKKDSENDQYRWTRTTGKSEREEEEKKKKIEKKPTKIADDDNKIIKLQWILLRLLLCYTMIFYC